MGLWLLTSWLLLTRQWTRKTPVSLDVTPYSFIKVNRSVRETSVIFDQSARCHVLKTTISPPWRSQFSHCNGTSLATPRKALTDYEWSSLIFKEGSAQCCYLYLGVTVRSVHTKSYCHNPFHALLLCYGFLIAGNSLSSSNKLSTCNTHKHTLSKSNTVSVFGSYYGYTVRVA